jgi:hypothetical protein
MSVGRPVLGQPPLVFHVGPVVARTVWHTHSRGFRLLATREFTTHDLVHLCDALSDEFCAVFGVPDGDTPYRWAPDWACEGGIQLLSMPGHAAVRPAGYKCMRMNLLSDNYQFHDRVADWHDALTRPARVLLPEIPKQHLGDNILGHTMIKACDAAPRWTRQELECVVAVCARFGLRRTGKWPSLQPASRY